MTKKIINGVEASFNAGNIESVAKLEPLAKYMQEAQKKEKEEAATTTVDKLCVATVALSHYIKEVLGEEFFLAACPDSNDFANIEDVYYETLALISEETEAFKKKRQSRVTFGAAAVGQQYGI